MRSNKTIIRDRWLFIFIYPAMGLLAVHIGNDNSFKQLIRIPSYYSDILLAFGCTFLFGLYIRKVYKRLHQRYDLRNFTRKNLLNAAFSGIILPTSAIVLTEVAYLLLLDFSIQKSSILYLELPLTVLFCTLINLVYFILYQNTFQKTETIEANSKGNYKTTFIVQSGSNSLTLPEEEVAYFIKKEGLTFLVNTSEKKYLYNQTLESINQSVAPSVFFQLNRQVIAHKQSIKKFHATETRRLQVELNPLLQEEVFVPKTKASAFVEWLK